MKSLLTPSLAALRHIRTGIFLLTAALLGNEAQAQTQSTDTIVITGRVFNDNNGGTIDGKLINAVNGRQLYIYLIDNRDSVVSQTPVLDNGTFIIDESAIAYRSYNVTLSSAYVLPGTRYPTLGLPSAWLPTAEGENGISDGFPDAGVAINASGDITIDYGINERPQGFPYAVTTDDRDANNRVKIPAAAFSGFDPEDGPYPTGLRGYSVDLFQANGGTLYYNNVAITNSSAAAGTRIHDFDVTKLRFELQPFTASRNFAYSIVDSAGAPELVPNIITLAVALPVELVSFGGRQQNGVNILEWSTASERINAGFHLERSTDGGTFTEVGFIESKARYGNSSAMQQYSFRDNTATQEAPMYFYRLRQVDLDGTESYSKIVRLSPGSGNAPAPAAAVLNAYPNPSTGALNLDWATAADHYNLAVYNNSGSVVYNRELPGSDGRLTGSLDLSSLPAGNYFLSITGGEQRVTRQITLQR